MNEHFWYDLHSVSAAADDIAAELGKLQPAKAQGFTATTGASALVSASSNLRSSRSQQRSPVPR